MATAPTPITSARPRKRRVRIHIHGIDIPTLIMILLLLAVGLLALYSASYSKALYSSTTGHDPNYYITKQLQWAVIGVGVMLLIARVGDYLIYGKLYKQILAVATIFMYLTPVIGKTVKGAKRWIVVAGIQFQPSELMKLALIITFAYLASRANADVRSLKGLIWPYGALLALAGGAMVLQKHLSGIAIMGIICVSILYAAGMRMSYFLPIIFVVTPLAGLYIANNAYAQKRIASWFDPFVDLQNTGWQGAMSHIAIGSGGIWGLGLGQGRQKHLYLPEPQNDFVFSSWCEEMGLVGAVLVLVLFGYLIYRGYYIATHARDQFGCLLAVGITSKLAVQTLLNLCVVSGLSPVTGASLPLFSYGGTAMLLQLAEFGLLLNISRSMKAPPGA